MSGTVGKHGKVELVHDGAVSELRLADPENRNCFSVELTGDLHELVVAAIKREATRVLVITADGPVFCAGADQSLMEGEDASAREEMLEQYSRAYDLLRNPELPVVAGARGAAIGAGASLLCWVSDIQVIGADIDIWWAGGNYGLAPLELAAYLKNEVGTPLAFELLLLGKHRTLSAVEAKELGLVNRVREPAAVADTVREIGRLIADIDASADVSRPLLEVLRATEDEQIGETLERARQDQSIGRASTIRD